MGVVDTFNALDTQASAFGGGRDWCCPLHTCFDREGIGQQNVHHRVNQRRTPYFISNKMEGRIGRKVRTLYGGVVRVSTHTHSPFTDEVL